MFDTQPRLLPPGTNVLTRDVMFTWPLLTRYIRLKFVSCSDHVSLRLDFIGSSGGKAYSREQVFEDEASQNGTIQIFLTKVTLV